LLIQGDRCDRAARYLRVSTGWQADNDFSISDQRRQAKVYCVTALHEFDADASGAPPLDLRFPLERMSRNNQREPVGYTYCRFNREQRACIRNILHNAINSSSQPE
jgi:hypothetical protein